MALLARVVKFKQKCAVFLCSVYSLPLKLAHSRRDQCIEKETFAAPICLLFLHHTDAEGCGCDCFVGNNKEVKPCSTSPYSLPKKRVEGGVEYTACSLHGAWKQLFRCWESRHMRSKLSRLHPAASPLCAPLHRISLWQA